MRQDLQDLQDFTEVDRINKTYRMFIIELRAYYRVNSANPVNALFLTEDAMEINDLTHKIIGLIPE